MRQALMLLSAVQARIDLLVALIDCDELFEELIIDLAMIGIGLIDTGDRYAAGNLIISDIAQCCRRQQSRAAHIGQDRDP